jgi:hypothetical protein
MKASLSKIIIIFYLIFSSQSYAGCMEMINKFFSKASFTVGRLPKGVEVKPLAISNREIKIWEQTKAYGSEVAGIKALNASGEEIVFISFSSLNDHSIDGKDVILYFNRLFAELSNKADLNKYVSDKSAREKLNLNIDLTLARIEMVHSHPGGDIAPSFYNDPLSDGLKGDFSMQDIKLSLQLKAIFEVHHADVDFGFGIIYTEGKDKTLTGKQYTLPKNLSWKNGDFEIDSTMSKLLKDLVNQDAK